KARPEVLEALLSRVLSTLPFMSTSQACSLPLVGQGRFTPLASPSVRCCWAIHNPCGEEASAFGQGPGALNSLVVLALRVGSFLRPPSSPAAAAAFFAPCAKAGVENAASARPAPARKSRLLCIGIPPVTRFDSDLLARNLGPIGKGSNYAQSW